MRLGQGEKLLVHLPPFVNIRMEVDLRGLDGGMTEIFLDHPQVLRTAVQFTGIAVPDLMRGNAGRGVMLENMLDCPR